MRMKMQLENSDRTTMQYAWPGFSMLSAKQHDSVHSSMTHWVFAFHYVFVYESLFAMPPKHASTSGTPVAKQSQVPVNLCMKLVILELLERLSMAKVPHLLLLGHAGQPSQTGHSIQAPSQMWNKHIHTYAFHQYRGGV